MAHQANIVFILVDDMGYGDFGCFNPDAQTPHLDALVGESLCLTQQYSGSPVCNPARAALLTGRYPHRTGSHDTLEWRGLERLALRERTLGDILSHHGYRTGLIGKWHLGAFDPRYHPSQRGFDEAVCFQGGTADYFDWNIDFQGTRRKADGRYMTDVWTEEACSFIRRNAKQQPFFLHLNYNAPHVPLQAPDEEFRAFDHLEASHHWSVRMLYAMLRRMDAGVGRVLETLRHCGLEQNTIVFFTSDNGPDLTNRGDWDLRRFNCHFNGAKGNCYEGGIRIPMVVRWPDGLPAGRTMDRMVHFCDWFPTILKMVGVRAPAGQLPLDGVDVAEALRGGGGSVCERRFWQWNRYTPMIEYNAAMRDGDWKLIRPKVEAMADAPCSNPWLRRCMYDPEYMERHGLLSDPLPLPDPLPEPPSAELYNLRDDPYESRNLASQAPERLRKMNLELENWFADVEQDRAAITDRWVYQSTESD